MAEMSVRTNGLKLCFDATLKYWRILSTNPFFEVSSSSDALLSSYSSLKNGLLLISLSMKSVIALTHYFTIFGTEFVQTFMEFVKISAIFAEYG